MINRAFAFQLYGLLLCVFMVTGIAAQLQSIWSTATAAYLSDYSYEYDRCHQDWKQQEEARLAAAKEYGTKAEPQPDYCDQPQHDARRSFKQNLYDSGLFVFLQLIIFVFHWKLAKKAYRDEL